MFKIQMGPSDTVQKIKWVTLLENNPYPADTRVRMHLGELVAAGYQVTVICPRRFDEPLHEIKNGVQIYRFPLPAYGSQVASYIMEFLHATFMITLLTLWVWLRHGLDVLHVSNPPDSLFVAALLPKLAGKTVVFDLRDLSPELYISKYEHTSPILYGLLIRFEHLICRLADHVITTNETYRKMVIERDGLKPAQISVIRQGPDLSRGYSPDPDPDVRSRAKTIIAYLGAMAPEDGIDHLLQALRQLDQTFGYRDWFCALVGAGDDLVGWQRLAEKLGLSDRTLFTGYLPFDRWVRVLAAADICIEPAPANPVNNISTTNKLMDYMALGKPTVGYGLSEQRVTAGEAALYAKSNDPVDMARQIMVLIENPELRERIGAIGRKRIEEQLAWHHQKNHLLTLCANITNRSSMRQHNKVI